MPRGWLPRRSVLGGGRVYGRAVRAKDLAESYPMSRLEDAAFEAVSAMVRQGRPGIVVLGEGAAPLHVLPASDVLRLIVPRYVQEDPSLAGVFAEKDAIEACTGQLSGRVVRDFLPPMDELAEPAVVPSDATVMECAALMVRVRSPLVVVADGDTIHGVITATHLLERLLGGPPP